MSTSTYTLVVDQGPLAGRRFPVSSAGLKLGRSSQCDIAISDLLLSRSHCRFELRGEELWVIDLASANQTLVNGTAVNEQRLQYNDVVSVGESSLRVARTEEAASTDGTAASAAAAADVVIDLGFGKDEDATAGAHKPILRPILWSLAALLVLVTGATLILAPSNAARSKNVARPQTIEADKSPVVYYEKIEASTDGIFRYEMTISPGGVLAVKIDDLSAKDRHVRKEKAVDPALLGDLSRDIESSGFFALDKSYVGFAAKPNTLNEWTLTCVIGKKAHTCQISNRLEPENFRTLREKLETFSKNELGIWAIQFSADKLTALARDTLSVATKKYDERDVKYGNLFDAIRAYQEAVFYLDTVNPKPDFYASIIDGFEAAQSELENRYKEQRFRANRAMNLSDWANAARELHILCEMIPERSDSRNKEATRQLVDVESRLKKSHR